MSENRKDKKTLFANKYNLLKQVYDITKGTIFVGDESDAERYIALHEQREPLFSEIFAIDKELDGVKDSADSANGQKNASVGTDADTKRINELISAIIKLDKEIEPYAKKVMDELKGNMKELKQGKELYTTYNQYSPEFGGRFFDTTN